ncbi:MAG: UvrD-helicase domain-containing protein [Kiritimatiellae bacterium]|nr:UvrD-helicase domain-containing protein [Kiritimatiellia bacterium]
MSKYLKGLNTPQRKAVTTTKGPLLILAGAGTGKTRVITHRIAHMLANKIPARSILAMTFTNKAAKEMRKRITQLVGSKSANDLTVGTFHSFCVKALRQFADRAGVRKNFGICDADNQLVAMKQALRELQIPETTIQPGTCISRISLFKNRMVSPEQLINSNDHWENTIGRAYKRYDRGLRTSGLLDFDDLLLYMVRLLNDKKTLEYFRKRYRFIMVDEYQDTNGPQYEIVKQIGEKHRNVCVVGDDDQSIYGWRGADVSKILHFEKDFPGATVVRLETNYRSTTEIIEGANAVIRNNASRHEKKLHSDIGNGDPIVARRLPDEETEAEFVVDDLVCRVREQKMSFGKFAILFRTQVQPRIFEMQLRQQHVPYILVGGMSFFDRKEVRDILAYLRLVENPEDELSLLRVINTPPRGIGNKTIETAMDIAAKKSLPLSEVFAGGTKSLQTSAVTSANKFFATLKNLHKLTKGPRLVELIKTLINDVGYAEEIKRCYSDTDARTKRWDAITEIMNMAEIHARKKSASLTSLLEDLTLNANDSDDKKTDEDKVTLMTLHSAKGLEFDQVYLVGMEEGFLPHARSIQGGDIAEERRLAYVGITRARQHLTMTYTQSRAKYGQRIPSIPSRFLYEMRGKPLPPGFTETVAKQICKTPTEKKKKPVKKKKTTKKKKTPKVIRKESIQDWKRMLMDE